MRIPFLVQTAAVSFGLLGSSFAADKNFIRPHYETGKVYTIENTMDMSTAVPGLGEQGKQATNVVQTMTITVKAEPGTDKRLATVKFVSIKANMSAMGQTMTYDSADPAKSQPMLQQAFGAILGKEFTLVYDKDDNIADVRGAENVMPTPVAGVKGPSGNQLADAFRKGQEMGLPKEAVAPGDTWAFDESVEMPPVGKISIKGTGKYDSIVQGPNGKQAKIVIEGQFKTPEGGDAQVKFGDGSTIKGETLFDLEKKLAVQNTVNTELKMTAAGQEVPMSQKVVNKIVSVADAK